MIINQGNFDQVNDILRDGNKVFVVPIFQRPYAWGERQVQQLLDDIDTGSRRNPTPTHYLSPIHVVQIATSYQKEWLDYVDQSNDDIIALNQSGFKAADGGAIRVYLVIDGQQRLTTLFSLFWQMSRSNLTFTCNDRSIPRLILCPTHDHYNFRQLLGLPTLPPVVSSKAQSRLAYCFTRSIDYRYQEFVAGAGFQLLMVALSVNYGLQAFQTQNDRGKSLTVLEKLKSLIMEYDLNNNCGFVTNIHTAFGNAYRVLDAPECRCTEDQYIQAISILLRIENDSDALWQGAEMVYEKYFCNEVKVHSSIHTLLSSWVDSAKCVTEQIERLDIRMNGRIAGPSCVMPSLPNRSLVDDYHIVIDSLGLDIRCLAALFKFGELYPDIDWHDKVVAITPDNNDISDFIEKRMQAIRGAINGECPGIISRKMKSLEERIENLKTPSTKGISSLEVIERVQLFTLEMGSYYPGGFKDYWNAAFKAGNSVGDAIRRWYEFATVYHRQNRLRFIVNLFEPYSKEAIIKYLLREYEYSVHGDNIHANKALQIEHIFSQMLLPKPPSGYFATNLTAFDYDNFVARIGNQMYLDGSLNSSINNILPPVKTQAYTTQSHNRIVVPLENQVKSAISIGKDFGSIMNLRHYQTYLDLREIELAIFATERFF